MNATVTIQTSHFTTLPDAKLVALKKMLDACGMDYPKELTEYFCNNYKLSLAELKDIDVAEIKTAAVASQLKEGEYSLSVRPKHYETLVIIEVDLRKIPQNDDKMIIELHLD